MKRRIAILLCLLFTLTLTKGESIYAASSALGISIPTKQVQVGESFSVDVFVNSSEQSINAVSGKMTFPASMLEVRSISKDRSIINLWTTEPSPARNQISFEGIILNPGYQGSRGQIFKINFLAKKAGTANFAFSEGAILANDGQGTNVLSTLGNGKVVIATAPDGSSEIIPSTIVLSPEPEPRILPVITKHTEIVEPNSMGFLRGRGQPNAFTRLVFQDIYLKSAAEKFLDYVRRNKEKPEEILVKNNEQGDFLYISGENLVAGAYNIIPYLVGDTEGSDKPGSGVQFLVKESPLVEWLIVLINILFLLVPIIILLIVIYFIPWYSFKRMRVLKKKLVFEEEKIESSEQELLHHAPGTGAPDKPIQ